MNFQTIRKWHLMLLCIIFFSKEYAQNIANRDSAITKNLAVFDSIYYKIINNYVENVSPQKLVHAAIDSMLASLDPFSNYIDSAQASDFKMIRNARYGGIGCVIKEIGDYILVQEAYERYPAFRAGLQPGDTIININGQPLIYKTVNETRLLLMGTPGTSVDLVFKHAGEKTEIKKRLRREEIAINAVPYFGVVNNDIGYINLTIESAGSSDDVRRALLNLKQKQQIKGLIFDLRGNDGGYIKEARKIVNLFLNKGDTIVSSRSVKKNEDTVFCATDSPVDVNIPIIILTDQRTVSAGEVITGALQDHDRGIVMGETTFGKGLMQDLYDFPDSSQLKLTIAYYYTPSGRCIESANYAGIVTSNKEIKLPDSLKKVYRTSHGRIVYSHGGIVPDIQFASPKRAAITRTLEENDLFFSYAIDYKLRHKTIVAAKDFHISNDEYMKFLDYLKNKKYNYETETEKKIKELEKWAKKEDYSTEINGEIEKLEKALAEDKKSALIKYKDDIKAQLEEEIVAVYYNNMGRYEYKLENDPEIAKATGLLRDKEECKKLLMPK